MKLRAHYCAYVRHSLVKWTTRLSGRALVRSLGSGQSIYLVSRAYDNTLLIPHLL